MMVILTCFLRKILAFSKLASAFDPYLNLVLLSLDISLFENFVDPDQVASDQDPHCFTSTC